MQTKHIVFPVKLPKQDVKADVVQDVCYSHCQDVSNGYMFFTWEYSVPIVMAWCTINMNLAKMRISHLSKGVECLYLPYMNVFHSSAAFRIILSKYCGYGSFWPETSVLTCMYKYNSEHVKDHTCLLGTET